MIALLLACGGEEALPEAAPEEPLGLVRASELKYTQEALASDPSAVTITGQLVCDRGKGPWKIRMWSLRRADRDRAPDVLPAGEILTETTLASPGPFTVLSPRSARLLVVAISDDLPPVLGWGDVHGRYTEAIEDLSDVVLDCSITPTPAPDGSRLATLGVVVQEEPEPAEPAGPDEQMERIIAIQAAPKVDVFSRKPSEYGGPETLDRIKDRYDGQLSEQELELHMPMLYQLADNPEDADEYVRDLVSQRADSRPSNTPQVVQ